MTSGRLSFILVSAMKVVLFAMTGFGNKALDGLLEEHAAVVAIFTRKEKGPFPYYPEENLRDYAERKGIAVFEEFSWQTVEETIRSSKPDLALIATFHKIIPKNVIDSVPLFINLHPSLLPKYKGPRPIEEALANQEKEIGITAHRVTEEVDSGDIALQVKISIQSADSAGSLRKKLAHLAASVTKELLHRIKTSALVFTSQTK